MTQSIAEPSATETHLLSVEDLSVRFGGLTAVDSVSFDVDEGQILGIIGPNGAGKTTLFNAISRLITATSGKAFFAGADITKTPPYKIPSFGVSRTFQNIALYPSLTVIDNVLLGAHCRTSSGFVSGSLRLPLFRRREVTLRVEASEVLRVLGLEGVAYRLAAGLPLGTRKRIELARALLARPRLVMLDEPANGLTSSEVAELTTLVKDLRSARNITFVLVEHHMGMVMSLCDRIVVLNFGTKIAEGTPAEIQRHPAVLSAYLGGQT